ncbi:MAG: peroxiredoxin [Gammaproteobacteria bacterium]|nr:peroxiredoxin [Gammaproteobacteria bacterium]
MSGVSIGGKIAEFKVSATGGKTVRLSDYKGRNLVLYFYPKDSTPGCTREGLDFRDNIRKFRAANTVVLGVSRDSIKSHESFKEKQEFPFDLLSDSDEKLCNQFGVIREKNLYGRKVLGVERSTFLIDAEGVLRREWRGVKVEGHAEEVLRAVKEL